MTLNAFPVSESTLSATHLGVLLQQQYGLSTMTRCTLFRTGMNHLYMVADGQHRFVLRIYTHGWRTHVDIAEELRLLQHLTTQGVKVSHPIADRAGEFIQQIAAPEGMRFAVLFSFAEGKKNAKFSEHASHQIGITMAKLHQATINFKFERVQYNPNILLKDSVGIIKSFFTNRSDDILFIEQMALVLATEYERVNQDSVRYGVVHFDMWFDNLHFGDGDEITIFDFDFCGNAWLCHDVSYFLYQLYSTHADKVEYKIKADAFLKGYATITPLTEQENKLIPILCLAVMVFYISMQCEKYDTWSNIFLNEDHLKRMVASLRNWVEYHHLELAG